MMLVHPCSWTVPPETLCADSDQKPSQIVNFPYVREGPSTLGEKLSRMEGFETAIADARRRGRLITVLSGIVIFLSGIVLLLINLFCTIYPENGPCPNFQGANNWTSYVGVFFVAIFCCTPCFALSEEEMLQVCLACVCISC